MCPGELEPPHAKAKGSECRNERKPGRQALAAGREQVCRRVRRPAGRSRGRATPATRTALADAPFPTEPDLPVCERHDPTGEPGALNRHAGFGERGAETWQCERMRHPHDAKAAGKRLLPHAKAGASLPDSTPTGLGEHVPFTFLYDSAQEMSRLPRVAFRACQKFIAEIQPGLDDSHTALTCEQPQSILRGWRIPIQGMCRVLSMQRRFRAAWRLATFRCRMSRKFCPEYRPESFHR